MQDDNNHLDYSELSDMPFLFNIDDMSNDISKCNRSSYRKMDMYDLTRLLNLYLPPPRQPPSLKIQKAMTFWQKIAIYVESCQFFVKVYQLVPREPNTESS